MLRFDEPVSLILSATEGRVLSVLGADLPATGVHPAASGLFQALTKGTGGFNVVANHYVRGQLTAAGAGTWLLFLTKENAPKPKPAAALPNLPMQTHEETATAQQTPKSSEDGIVEPSLPKKHEQPAVAPPSASTSGAVPQTPVQTTESGHTPLPPAVEAARQIAQQGDRDRAMTLLQSIQPGESSYGWSRVLMGELYERSGDFSKALDRYREALIDPLTEAVAAVHLALAFQAMGNPDAASGMWERVLQLGGGKLVNPPDVTQQASGHPTASSPVDRQEAPNPRRHGRPLWLTVLLGVAIIALLGGLVYGVILLTRMLQKRKGSQPDEFDLDLDSDLMDDESPLNPTGGANARAARSYQEQATGADLAGLAGESFDDAVGDAVFADGSEGPRRRAVSTAP